MPFCPKCHSEYREGFKTCPPCDDTELVDELPKIEELRKEDVENTLPVGSASSAEVGRPIEVGGRVVDLLRVHILSEASALEHTLLDQNIPAIIVPLEGIDFPDGQQRFEVRVKKADHERAETLIREIWAEQVDVEGTGADADAGDAEQCPACGSHVPLDVEECPECGLVVGAGGAEPEDEPEEEPSEEP